MSTAFSIGVVMALGTIVSLAAGFSALMEKQDKIFAGCLCAASVFEGIGFVVASMLP